MIANALAGIDYIKLKLHPMHPNKIILVVVLSYVLLYLLVYTLCRQRDVERFSDVIHHRSIFPHFHCLNGDQLLCA